MTTQKHQIADSVALVSGGLDSVVMLYQVVELGKSPLVVIFDYQQASYREIEYARYHAVHLGLFYRIVKLSLPDYQMDEVDNYKTYVPMRNLVLLSLAASLAEDLKARYIYTGFHQGPNPRTDLFWDTTSEFVDTLNKVLALNNRLQTEVKSPLVDMFKSDIIKLGYHLGVNFSKTWSCYENRDKACGLCPICKSRLRNFRAIGLEDPLEYETR